MLLLFLTLPVCAIEVIQSKNEEDIIKQNTRTFNQNLQEEADNGIYIPNPIDYLKEKRAKNEVKEPQKPTSMVLDCDEMEYKNDIDEVEARGHVVITSSPEKTKITADKAIFNRKGNFIKLFDNVKLYKDGGVLKGDYMVVDLNKENVLMNEPLGEFSNFKITAREGYAYANKIEAINGDFELADKIEMKIASFGFGTFYDMDMINEQEATFEMRKKRSEPYKIKTKEIIIKSHQDHDEITFKNVDIYYKKYKLATAPDLSILTDKEQNYIELNGPELGSMSNFGTYVGPGFTTRIPGNSTLKVIPALVYSGGAGIGVLARHRSKRNFVEAGWATSSKNLVIRGKYRFNKELWVDYSRHGYVDEWFNGYMRPGYMGQLVHHKAWENKDLGATFTQRLTAGYVSEYSEDDQEEQIGTARVRWQGELSKTLFKLENKEQDMYIKGYVAGQAAATLYGTGQTTGLVRFTPGIQSRVKGWGSRIYVAAAGVHGRSPFIFDDYRYGKISVSIDENIRLCKYLSVGYRGTLSPMRDNYDEQLLTENAFYVMAGPEDFKIAVAYDNVREITSFDVVMLVGANNAKMKYDKLTAQDPSNMGKKRKLFEEWNLRKIKVPTEEAI